LVKPTLIRNGIELSENVQVVPKTRYDEHALCQILVNLLVNAQEAVLASGKKSRRVAVVLSERADGGQTIRISDNGVGIPTENRDRIFTLGFTTRVNGQGLGLYVSAKAAKSMGSSIQVFSRGAGRGASFSISFTQIPVFQGSQS
jgi:C4-dicarboxylate-specific signal transduction histidine kinase